MELPSANKSAPDKLPLAIQIYSVRSLLGERFKETLRALADIGFTAVELFGLQFGGMTPGQLADFFNEIGIKAVGMHCAPKDLLDPDSLSYDYAMKLQCKFVTVSMAEQVKTDWQSAAAHLKQANAVAADRGLTLTYHNHGPEFAKLPDGRTALDALFDGTADFNLHFLFDVLFAFSSGYDPCKYLERFAGRVPQIHFNDLDCAGRDSANPARGGMDISTELGTGGMDLPAIYRTAGATGVQWVVLEQHTQRANPLESARRNFAYCQNLFAEQE